MRAPIVLAIFGLFWFSIAFANMFLGNGRLLPGWIIVGVVFLTAAGFTYAFGGESDTGHGSVDA